MKDLKSKGKKAKRLLEDLYREKDSFYSSADTPQKGDDFEQEKIALLFFLTKHAHKLLGAMLLLLKDGRDNSAHILLRSFCEVYIYSLYIGISREHLGKYLLSQTEDKLNLYNGSKDIIKVSLDINELKDEKEFWLKRFDLEENYKKMPNLKGVCEEVDRKVAGSGLVDFYKVVYKLLSKTYSHPKASGISSTVFEKENIDLSPLYLQALDIYYLMSKDSINSNLRERIDIFLNPNRNN